MKRFDFTMECIFGGRIEPTEYTDRDSGERKLSAPKIQLLRESDTGRLEPVEIKEETFRVRSGVDPSEIEFGTKIHLTGVMIVRDGFEIFETVSVNGHSA